MHRPLEHAPAVVAENRQRYEILVEMAQHYAGRDDVERMLGAAMLAGNYAWLAPGGLLSDIRLERTVVHAVRGCAPVTVDGGRRAGRVLHVLTEAYGIGGHTRQAAEWITRDDRVADVALTNQQAPVPDRITEAVRTSGGDLHDLRSTAPALLDRAVALRRLMDRADLVVLTVHPYDAVALAAVNLPGVRPPVIYANHADHSFWLGVAGADLVCDWRDRAATLHAGLRNVPAERIGVLPLPISPMPPADGSDLRRKLGIRPDAVVAVTVSTDWKTAAAWGRGMHHVLDRALHWSPQLTVVLVGVPPNDDWRRLAKRYRGRVFPLGVVPSAAPYLDLADIYLESYPLQAGTTPLEAAAAGLPIVTLTDLPVDDPARIFQSASPGLAGRPPATSAERFAVTVRRLVVDPELRRREGAEVQSSVLGLHDGPGWSAQLEAVYEQARALPAVDVDDLAESPTDARYAAMVCSAISPAASCPDPVQLAGPLGGTFDSRMRADVLAGLLRRLGRSFRVRVAPRWYEHEAWTARLLELCSTYPRLSVSLPFLPGDERDGGRTEAALMALLAGIGRTPDECGDVSVDSGRPPHAGPELTGEPSFTGDVLDWLEELVGSPLWDGGEVLDGRVGSSVP